MGRKAKGGQRELGRKIHAVRTGLEAEFIAGNNKFSVRRHEKKKIVLLIFLRLGAAVTVSPGDPTVKLRSSLVQHFLPALTSRLK